ncbi:hypothetical protein G3N56_16310 [Desulfovibrio sulfodismutans]|uniref:Uncharacterized protein n=1 Tax=Desulfolutivibrio sulfodismutans TaxID=63561 RepID=A0A7K3NQD3_9BACT|nr:hypothetical protein [Desulfolutivibrio sulfodismutans]NDY58297.1 hypothetical protein [Desulfolutivibrio sulfodismutans]QLA12640.1 hypothetical protein GD606_10330 [Desulfolutivibrio sulfodismutans DSM 3696]
MSLKNLIPIKDVGNMMCELLSKEEHNIVEAKNYLDMFFQTDSSDIKDLEEVIDEFLDGYISLIDAIKIIDELNRYILAEENVEADLRAKYGHISKKFEEISDTFRFVRCTSPRVENIWEMKKYDRDYFNKILKIATQENKEVMKNQAIVRIALLRFYIKNVFRTMKDANFANQDGRADVLKSAISLGIGLHQIELFSEFTEDTFLGKFHSIGASANKKKRDEQKNSDIGAIATEAWEYGCELLHTQLLHLFILTGVIDHSKEVSAKNKLKKVAPSSRIYGPGSKKTIDTCPCNKEHGCPLLQKIPMRKRLDLPVSKKHLKSK